MPRAYRQLDLAERRTIFRLLNAKTPIAVIARELDRHRSTIHREVRRNHFHGPREYAGYYPLNAQDLASERRKRMVQLPSSGAHLFLRINGSRPPRMVRSIRPRSMSVR